MCGICDIVNVSPSLFTEEEMNYFLTRIYEGSITTSSLDLLMYEKISAYLTKGVFEGYGETLDSVKAGSEDWYMLRDLQENVYAFSAAKQYQLVRDLSAGVGVLSFEEFKKNATNVFKEYNNNYLGAEYNSAVAQARSVVMWKEIERDAGEYGCLKYTTVHDGRVRPEHAELDGIVAPIKDKFWSTYFPPNGWNCRCTTLQIDCDSSKPTDLSGFKAPKDVPSIFKFNAAKERMVYSDKHPYFDVPSKDKDLALSNFGLPLP